ncbi:MAG: aminopeptidase [Clostridiaceae bacterium]|nr:aminopeptidase [Clostridiaceae bacterium]
MTLEVFLLMLLIVSTLTGLVTEAIKKWLQERDKKYYANTLAGYVAVVMSAAIGAAYIILAQTVLNAQMAVYLIALVFLSWLSAMVGYDKVIQAISQFKDRR